MLIDDKLIQLNIKAKDKEQAILELIRLAQREGRVTSAEVFLESVLEREKTYTTGVGNGIAIPHGKSNSVKEAMVVFGKSLEGVEWDSLDGNPVNLIFLIGVPEENANNQHLKLLSQLSRKLMNEDFVEELKRVSTKEEVLEALNDIEII